MMKSKLMWQKIAVEHMHLFWRASLSTSFFWSNKTTFYSYMNVAIQFLLYYLYLDEQPTNVLNLY